MKMLSVFLNIIKIAIVICTLLYFAMFLKTKTILNHGFYVVNGNSMYPTLKNNDFLIASKTTDVKVGDIICFEQNGKLIVHRVIYKNQDKLITKGDFNKFQDEKISIKQIRGKVVYKSSVIGFIYSNLHIVIIILCLVVMFNLFKFNK